jgi:hypothetical protein
MRNAMQIFKHLFGSAIYIKPVSDKNIYKVNKSSFTGNSLDGSNVLVVTNFSECSDEIIILKEQMKNEHCNCSVISLVSNELAKSDIIQAGADLVGTYEHIINLFRMEKGNCTQEDSVRLIYQILQIESDYLIEDVKKGSLCTAIISDDEVVKNTVSSLLKGLGGVLGNHSVIENGIASSRNVPIDKIVKTSAYLSSKYGQILAGEVLNMEM